MRLADLLQFSFHALSANRFRTFLTALGLVIGNASVILVVTISLTSEELILSQIQAIGSNMVYAQYEAGTNTSAPVDADFIKFDDVEAVRKQFAGRIVAATGVMVNYDRIRFEGKDQDIAVIGSDDQYIKVRNLLLLAGRFMDAGEVHYRQKVAMITEKLAVRMFGSQMNSIGQIIKIRDFQFTVIGTFKERTESMGLSELAAETVLIPITVMRYYVKTERIDPMYVQAVNASEVEPLTRDIKTLLESRHRAGARYKVENLGSILAAAQNISIILRIVLVFISAIALLISGIGIMNIMLVTVTERTREIGIRMSIGASRRAVMQQFLIEAVLISVGGGLVGIIIGLAIPITAQYFAEGIAIPIAPVSVIVAFCVSVGVGLGFGLLPASRASRLNPTEALRYE
ncbi:MAG: ABC transporter permease [Acidobacteria bacterium]|nr:ABC transporter permease [Acidobacteriota bacterium]